MTFQPRENMEQILEGLVKSGDYTNQSEVIRLLEQLRLDHRYTFPYFQYYQMCHKVLVL